MLLQCKSNAIFLCNHKVLIFNTIRIMAENCEFLHENTFVMKFAILSHCAKSKV